VAFAARQHRYGRPLCELPTIKQKLGQMQSRLMIARLAAYHAVHLLDHGLPCDAELMNAKLINVEYALDSARNAMEVHAACGLFADRPIERFMRDGHHIFAPAGTSDVQLLRLAEFALGTSKTQWSQRLAASAGSQAYRQCGCPVSFPHSPASCDAAKGDSPDQRYLPVDFHAFRRPSTSN
jgi:acyl-CoA dehydrogenase